VFGGAESLDGTLFVPGGDDSVGRDRGLPAPRVACALHSRLGPLYLPRFLASRCGMASTQAPDAAAAMAADREAQRAGSLLNPEEDIDDGVLSNLVSAC